MLVVWKLDRLGRSLAGLTALVSLDLQGTQVIDVGPLVHIRSLIVVGVQKWSFLHRAGVIHSECGVGYEKSARLWL